MNAVPPSHEERVTLAISPVRRAQDAFALARYMNRRSCCPHFQMTHLTNDCAVFVTTREGWVQLRRALETESEEVLCIASVQGDHVSLRMSVTCPRNTMAQTGLKSQAEDSNS